jgi:hypothetical protein
LPLNLLKLGFPVVKGIYGELNGRIDAGRDVLSDRPKVVTGWLPQEKNTPKQSIK